MNRIYRRWSWILFLILPPLWAPTLLPSLAALSLAGLLLFFLGRWIALGRPVPRTDADIAIVLLLLAAAMGLWVSPKPLTALTSASRMLLGVALYYGLIDRVRDWDTLVGTVIALSLFGGGVALVGLFATNWFTDKLPILGVVYRSLPRVSLGGVLAGGADPISGGFHPNMVAGTLVLMIPLGIAAFWSVPALVRLREIESRWWVRGVARSGQGLILLSVLSMLVTLALTQSRTGIVALVLALLVWVGMASGWFRLALPAGLALLLASAQLYGLDRLPSLVMTVPESTTWMARPALWRVACQAISDYPLTGVGLGAFEVVARANYVTRVSPMWEFGHSHNLILQMWADLGWLGGLAFLFVLLCAGRLAWRIYRHPGFLRVRWVGGAVVASLIGYFLFSMLNVIPLGGKPGFLLWLVLALLERTDAIGTAGPGPAESHTLTERWSIGSRRWGLGVMAAVLSGVILFYPAVVSAVNSNLGAVALDKALLQEGLTSQARASYLRAAIDYLDRAAARADRDVIHRRLGIAHYSNGDVDRAVSHWRRDSQATEFLLSQGENMLARGDPQSARRLWQSAIEVDPTAPSPHWRMAQFYAEKADNERALREYLRAIALASDDRAEQVDGRHQEVLTDSYLQAGAILASENRWSEAVGLYRRGLEVFPNGAMLRISLGQALYEAYGDGEAAEAEMSKALSADPMSIDARLALSSLYRREERYEKAAETAREGIRLAPDDHRPWQSLGQIYLDAGDYEASTTALESAVALATDLPSPYFWLGMSYLAMEKPSYAAQAFSRVTELDPDSSESHFYLGESYRELGWMAEARMEYERTLELDPAHGLARQRLEK